MPSLSPPLTSLLSLALATSMAAATLPATAVAATRGVTAGAAMHSAARLTARQMAPASVLGLDGEDTEASAKLTDALRAAFKARGLSGGEEISLVEMRLTMGCSNLEPKCLSEGGEALSVDKLIYGELHTQGDDFQLELQVLDVATREVTNQESFKVTAEDLELDNIDARSMAIVTELLGLGSDSESVPSAGADYETDPEPETDPVVEDERRERQYWFGRDKDGPRWKKAGLGVGIGLAVAGLGTAIALGVQLPGLEGDVYEAIADTSEAANAIDPAVVAE
ncbi:MAG: hypothetical protein JKY37_25240, partial [Nannocystaceae bacterium]|nr:hypothetical protein [Nannocystaceae bacterium]